MSTPVGMPRAESSLLNAGHGGIAEVVSYPLSMTRAATSSVDEQVSDCIGQLLVARIDARGA